MCHVRATHRATPTVVDGRSHQPHPTSSALHLTVTSGRRSRSSTSTLSRVSLGAAGSASLSHTFHVSMSRVSRAQPWAWRGTWQSGWQHGTLHGVHSRFTGQPV